MPETASALLSQSRTSVSVVRKGFAFAPLGYHPQSKAARQQKRDMRRRRPGIIEAMFGDWLRDVLEKSHLPQAELARRLSADLGRAIDKNAVNKIVLGTRKLYADELLAICRICNTEIPFSDGLFSLSKNRPSFTSADLYQEICFSLVQAVWIKTSSEIRDIAGFVTSYMIGFLARNNITVDIEEFEKLQKISLELEVAEHEHAQRNRRL